MKIYREKVTIIMLSTTIIISTIHYATSEDHQLSSVSIWHIISVVCLAMICIILSIVSEASDEKSRDSNVPSLPFDDDAQCFKCPECQTVNEGLLSKWQAKKLERDRMMTTFYSSVLIYSFLTRQVFTLGGDPKSSSRTTTTVSTARRTTPSALPPTLTSIAKTTAASNFAAKRSTASVNANVTLTDLTVDLSLFVNTILADTANTFLVTANTLKTETSASEVVGTDSTSILSVQLGEKSSTSIEKLERKMNDSKKEGESSIETELRVLNWGDFDDENLVRDLNKIVGGPKNSSTPNNSVNLDVL
uniref:Uncharacterized protein n=1 Tax=Romanomermis culicivorax TaxID=13658 RepID=A0A915HP25_ROMCU